MAENKKSFVAYADWKETFDKLPDEVAGKLIKHIFAYVNDENPVSEDFIIEAVFSNIKNTLKRDLKKWESQLEQRREAGRRSAEQRALTKSNERSISLNETQRNSTVSDSVSDSVILLEKETKDNSNLSVDWEKLKNNFNQLTGKKIKLISNKAKTQIKARLKEGYTKQDLWNAILNCFNDPYHKENPRYLTLEFISRSDKMEKYCTDIKKPKIKEDRL